MHVRLVVVVAAICDRTPPPLGPPPLSASPSPSLEAAVGHHAHSGGLELILKHLNLQGGGTQEDACVGGEGQGGYSTQGD